MGFEQTPPAEVPAVWHWSSAVHTTGFAPVHVPAWHVSVCVQALPSSHELPLALMGLEQTPAEQVPAVWHWSSAVQTVPTPPVQLPAWHASPDVHELPS